MAADPVTIQVELGKIDILMKTLEEALRPKVTFTGNLEEMREEAASISTNNVLASLRMLRDIRHP